MKIPATEIKATKQDGFFLFFFKGKMFNPHLPCVAGSCEAERLAALPS
jgi:hypothetical protein